MAKIKILKDKLEGNICNSYHQKRDNFLIHKKSREIIKKEVKLKYMTTIMYKLGVGVNDTSVQWSVSSQRKMEVLINHRLW